MTVRGNVGSFPARQPDSKKPNCPVHKETAMLYDPDSDRWKCALASCTKVRQKKRNWEDLFDGQAATVYRGELELIKEGDSIYLYLVGVGGFVDVTEVYKAAGGMDQEQSDP